MFRSILKGVLLSVFMTNFIGSLMAQDTIFIAEFETQSLGLFKTTDLDNLPLSEEFEGLSGGFQVLGVAGPSDLRAVAVSSFQNGGQADNWLISPPIIIEKSASILKWTATSLSAEAILLEDYRVMISTTGTEIGDFQNIAVDVDNESPMSLERSFDLSFYEGQTIHVAFHQDGVNKYALSVDNIYVIEPGPVDNAEAISFVGERYQSLILPDILIEIQNTGSEVMTSVELEGDIAGSTGSFVFEDLNVPVGESIELLFSNLFPFEVGRYEINARVKAVNGNEVSNSRTITSTYYFVNGGSPKKLVLEESTSTTCGWCPAGIVNRQKMNATYPSQFISIAVHNDDPMQVPIYDLGLRSQLEFGGTPSATINRKAYVGVEEVKTYFTSEFSTTTPARLDINYDYNDATRELEIEMVAFLTTNFGDDTHRFSCVLVEDFVQGEDESYDQANFYSASSSNIPLVDENENNWQLYPNPVPAADMVYHDVARALIGGFDGIPQSISASSAGTKVTYDLDYLMPSTFRAENMSIIMLLIDTETGEIAHAHKEKLEFESSVDQAYTPSPFKLYPNPAHDHIMIQMDTQSDQDIRCRLMNNQSQIIKTLATKSADSTPILIQREGLVAGLYFLEISIGDQKYVEKIIFN